MKRKLISFCLFLWISTVMVAFGYTHGIHRVVFNSPTTDLIKLSQNKITTEYGMTHILTKECGCSEIIFEYLIERGAQSETQENVLLLEPSPDWEKELTKKGFNVSYSKEVKGFVSGVPMLIIFNKNGEIKYTGGYANKIITPITQILDLTILKNVKENLNKQQYAVRGCAVNKKLQKELDPFGLKYN